MDKDRIVKNSTYSILLRMLLETMHVVPLNQLNIEKNYIPKIVEHFHTSKECPKSWCIDSESWISSGQALLASR